MSLRYGFNSFASTPNAASNPAGTAPAQTLLSYITNIQVTPTCVSHGIDATKPVLTGEIQNARNGIQAGLENNTNILAAVGRAAEIAKKEMDAAGKAAGLGGAAGAFERTPNMAGSEGGLLLSAVTGAVPAGQGSFATAGRKVMEGLNAGAQVENVMGDRNLSCEDAKSEIANILALSSQAVHEETAGFGLILQADEVPRIPVSINYDGIVKNYGPEGLDEVYNLDVADPSSAFSELIALHAANREMENQLAQLGAIKEQLNRGDADIKDAPTVAADQIDRVMLVGGALADQGGYTAVPVTEVVAARLNTGPDADMLERNNVGDFARRFEAQNDASQPMSFSMRA